MPNHATSDLIVKKIATVQDVLGHLEKFLPSTFAEFQDQEKTYVTERAFQLVVDGATELNRLIIDTDESVTKPDTYANTFAVMAQMGALPEEFARDILFTVSLRNRLIHGYEKVQRKIEYEDIKKALPIYKQYLVFVNVFIEKK
jgi:uncharacterized protein YutE (UPF0331/DUF86 family)